MDTKIHVTLDAFRRASQQTKVSVLSKVKRELIMVLVDCTRLLIKNKHMLTDYQVRQLRRRTEEV